MTMTAGERRIYTRIAERDGMELDAWLESLPRRHILHLKHEDPDFFREIAADFMESTLHGEISRPASRCPRCQQFIDMPDLATRLSLDRQNQRLLPARLQRELFRGHVFHFLPGIYCRGSHSIAQIGACGRRECRGWRRRPARPHPRRRRRIAGRARFCRAAPESRLGKCTEIGTSTYRNR